MPSRKSRTILSMIALTFISAACIYLAGCAGITPPSPEDMASRPFGAGSIRVGMTKPEVESIWGKPEEVRIVEDKERWGGARELWVYRAQFGAVPVNVGYLSKARRLYFDGDNLTNIEE